jgi:hypothetical protein
LVKSRKRSIGNAITITLNDGTELDEVEVEYPVGHRRRRSEGIPLLFEKFERHIKVSLLLLPLKYSLSWSHLRPVPWLSLVNSLTSARRDKKRFSTPPRLSGMSKPFLSTSSLIFLSQPRLETGKSASGVEKEGVVSAAAFGFFLGCMHGDRSFQNHLVSTRGRPSALNSSGREATADVAAELDRSTSI